MEDVEMKWYSEFYHKDELRAVATLSSMGDRMLLVGVESDESVQIELTKLQAFELAQFILKNI